MIVNGTWDITTGGNEGVRHLGQELRRHAGSGGDGGWTGTSSGGGGQGTEGGIVQMTSGGNITTIGATRTASSVRASAGSAATAAAAPASSTRAAAAARRPGSGGSVDVTNNGTIIDVRIQVARASLRRVSAAAAAPAGRAARWSASAAKERAAATPETFG